MKTLHLIILLLALSVPRLCRAQFVWTITQDHQDDSVSTYKPVLLDCFGTHCTAIVRKRADTYLFMRSDDGGLSWHTQWSLPEPPTPYQGFNYFYAVQQIDSANAVVVGDSAHIFRTFDAGVTWTKQTGAAP